MKRILSFALAASLLLAALAGAASAAPYVPKITGVNQTLALWQNTFVLSGYVTGAPAYVPLGHSTYTRSGGTTPTQLIPDDLQNLSVTVDTNSSTNAGLVSAGVALINQGQPAAAVAISLTRNSSAKVLQNTAFTLNLRLTHTVPNGGAVTSTPLAALQGTVQAQDGSLTGINDKTGGSYDNVSRGDTVKVPLQDSQFTYITNVPAQNKITAQKISDYGISVSSSNSKVSASLITGDGAPYILLTKNSDSTETTDIIVSGGRNGMENKSGKITGVTLNTLSVPSTPPYVTGVAAGAGAPRRTDSLGGRLTVGDVLIFELSEDQFTWSAGTGDRTFRAQDLNTGWIKGYDSSLFDAAIHVDASGRATLRLTAKAVSTATTTLSLALDDGNASTRALSGVTISSISDPVPVSGNTITGINPDAYLGDNITKNGHSLSSGESESSLEVRPGDKIQLNFDSDFFEWKNGSPSPAAPVSASALSRGKITVRKSSGKNSSIIEDVSFKSSNGRAYVEIEFVDLLVSTSDKEFDLTVYLAHNGSRSRDTEVQLTGVLANEYIEVDENDDYIDISDGAILESDGYNRNIEVYIGDGLSLYPKLFSGRKYYAVARQEVSSSDERILDRYPSIETVYRLYVVGMNTSGKIAEFDLSDKYYVYGDDGKYLGTTNERLPFSSKYYLSSKRITLASSDNGLAVEEEEPSGEQPAETPGVTVPGGTPPGDSGGSGSGDATQEVPAVGANDNPHNGAFPLQIVGSLLGALFLTAGGLLLMKKE